MTFKNDLEVYQALLAGETVQRFDCHTYIEFKFIDKNVHKSYDSGKTWDQHPLDTPYSVLKVKQKTFKIGDIEVPEPVREPLPKNTVYYIPSFSDYTIYRSSWWGSQEDIKYLDDGLIHLTREDAQKHAQALISLSKIDNK